MRVRSAEDNICKSKAAIVKFTMIFDLCMLFDFDGLGFALTFRRTDILPADDEF